eukprot:10124330-Alexandrium_andersonii.AAC.1
MAPAGAWPGCSAVSGRLASSSRTRLSGSSSMGCGAGCRPGGGGPAGGRGAAGLPCGCELLGAAGGD